MARPFAMVALAAAAVLGLPDSGHAQSAGDIRVIVGMHTYNVKVTPHWHACGTSYWHCDEGNHPNNTGLDMSNAVGGTGGQPVSFQSYTNAGYAHGTIMNHQYGSSLCPGADVVMWVPSPVGTGTWIGSINFVQVNVTQTFGTGFYLASSGYTIHAMGNIVNGPGTGGCPSDAAHLHQSGTHNTPWLWTNWSVESDDDPSLPGRNIYPTGSSSSNWLHWISY